MLFRAIGLAVPVVLGGYYFTGGFDGGYSRVVDRPPAQVLAALDDLDIRDQPGSPGTDPAAAGGVAPVFRHARTATGAVWTVMSGDKVAVTMTAELTPVDDGKRTRVTARVARGDAPDDFVSPAFRSTGITMGLFALALEGELDELTAPPAASAEKCRELFERFEEANLASEDLQHNGGTVDRIGDVAAVTMRLNGFMAEARRLGCPAPAADRPFAPVSSKMKPAAEAPADGVRFEPGKPMVSAKPGSGD